MGVVTTYVCDVSGVSGDKREDFVDVKITSTGYGIHLSRVYSIPHITIHTDVAKRMGMLYCSKKEEEELPPPPSLEEKLTTLLKEYISNVAQDVVENQ